MLRDPRASSDGAPASPAQFDPIFDARLYHAAQQLIDGGGVSDLRVLQHGRVVTGIADAKHRIYIQYQGTRGQILEGECSCSERSPCVHVAAVAMAAARNSSASAPGNRTSDARSLPRPPDNSADRAASVRQSLSYLIEPAAARGFQLTIWVSQTLAGSACAQPGACQFALRTPDGTRNFPRYVDAQDRAILDALTARRADGPRELSGPAGSDLLNRVIATGRAVWRSLQGRALRAGGPREVPFAWQVLPNGDQRMASETPESLDFLLELEPAVYIDATSGDCGPLLLRYPTDLLRQHCSRAAITPAQVAAINERLAHEAGAADFPRPRAMAVRDQSLDSLRARLVIPASLEPTLHFLYNGTPVDSSSLRADQQSVRHCDGDIVYEVKRDRDIEQRLRMQLDRVLTHAPRDGEAWLAFMITGVPALEALGWEITTDPHFPYRLAAADDWYADLQTNRRPRAHRPRGAHSSREWFDLHLGVMVEGQAVNLLPALVRYLQGNGAETAGQHDALSLLTGEHLLVRLEDGRYLPVPIARIQRIADTLVELYEQDGLNTHQALTLPATQAGRLAQLALGPDAPTLQSDDPSLLALIDTITSFSGIRPLSAPEHFQATLRPYQQDGLGWLQFLRHYGLGGILADDMGLGKTVQTLAHLAIEKQQGRLNKPSLIVAPVSVLGNWQQEIRRFAPELKLLTLHGAKRKDVFASIDSADIVIVGYPLLLLDSEILLAREFCFVILDEAQAIKNPGAKVSQVARALRADHRLCLTGTPMENNLGELWSLFDFVQPGLLGERQHFQRLYRTPIENGGNTQRARALSRRIQPFLLRRTKDAVARDLPPKIQIVEPIEFDERQRDFYDGIRLWQHRRVREAIEQQGVARSHITVLDALLKLRQACCDPRLVPAHTQAQVIPSAKLDWLSTSLPELIAEGRRILLFSQFTSMLQLIERVVKDLSIPYCLLTGETRQRTLLVERFQAGGVPLFLISLKAGGTGLNLTAADTIIHYDPWWNPAVEAQATDRAHRIGQEKTVFVYKLIARGTVEEKIMQLQADKHALVSQLYAGKNSLPTQLTSADLEALFEP